MAVEVRLGSVVGAWRAGGFGSFWLELRTGGGSDEVFAAVVQAANDREEGRDGVFAQLGTRSPRGFVTMVESVESREQLVGWLDGLARGFEAAGLSGSLQGAAVASWPRWITGEASSPVRVEMDAWCWPVGFLGWSFDFDAMVADPHRDGSWLVDSEATRRLCSSLARWVGADGGSQIVMSRSTFPFLIEDPEAMAGILQASVAGTGMGGALRYEDVAQRGRLASLMPGGECAVSAIGGPASRVERIDGLRSALVALPELLDQAFVRPASRFALGWSQFDHSLPLPGISEVDVRYNKHLLAEFLVDAHGVQVVRDAHLAKVRDLSGWEVTDLGHGRHLVEARDLEPWYGSVLPDLGTLARARADFGAAILTPEVIAANPPPWRGPVGSSA